MLGGLFSSGDSEEKFWKWFLKNKEQIADINSGNLLIEPALVKQLKKYDKALGYELLPVVNKKNVFCISTNHVREVIPSVLNLADSAPEMEGWQIQKFIPRKNINNHISWNALEMRHEDLLFQYTIYKGQAHLRIYIKGYDMKDERFRTLSVMFLQAAFGEFDFMTKIGALEYVPYKVGVAGEDIASLPELINIVDNEVR